MAEFPFTANFKATGGFSSDSSLGSQINGNISSGSNCCWLCGDDVGYGVGWYQNGGCNDTSPVCCDQIVHQCPNYWDQGGYSATTHDGYDANGCSHTATGVEAGPGRQVRILIDNSSKNTIYAALNQADKASIDSISYSFTSNINCVRCVTVGQCDYSRCPDTKPLSACPHSFRWMFQLSNTSEQVVVTHNDVGKQHGANCAVPSNLSSPIPINEFKSNLDAWDISLYNVVTDFIADYGGIKLRFYNFNLTISGSYTKYVEHFYITLNTKPKLGYTGNLVIDGLDTIPCSFSKNGYFSVDIGHSGNRPHDLSDGDSYRYHFEGGLNNEEWFVIDCDSGQNPSGTFTTTEGGSVNCLIESRLLVDGGVIFKSLPITNESNILYSLESAGETGGGIYKGCGNFKPTNTYEFLCDANAKQINIPKETGFHGMYIYYNGVYTLTVFSFRINDENNKKLISVNGKDPNLPIDPIKHTFAQDDGGNLQILNPQITCELDYTTADIKYETDVEVKVYEIDNKDLYNINDNINHLYQDDFSSDYKGLKNIKQFKRENF